MKSRYRKLGECLGEGSYKTVTKAIDEEEGKEVAYNEVKIKVYEEDTHAGNSFSKEIALLKNINHPNIIKILDYWFTEDNFIFVTELMTGGTVRDYINKVGPLNSKLIRKWGKQILEGLCYLHTLDPPIIHRDIKNENIFVNSSQGEIKIGDLGIAREKKHKRYTIVGTPNFMAKEMFEGDGYSEKVDVYAFGMCLLEMATGNTPYSEYTDSNDVYRCVLQGMLPKTIQTIENVCLRSLIMNCLASQSERYTAMQCLEHHFFYPDIQCDGNCLPNNVDEIISITDSTGELELSLLSFTNSTITFQLMISGSLRFIKFDYDIEVDSLEKVSNEMLEERIIEGSVLESFRDLLERGIRLALDKKEEGEPKSSEQKGEEVTLRKVKHGEEISEVFHVQDSHPLQSPSDKVLSDGIEKLLGTNFEFGEKTLEVMKEIDAEMRAEILKKKGNSVKREENTIQQGESNTETLPDKQLFTENVLQQGELGEEGSLPTVTELTSEDYKSEQEVVSGIEVLGIQDCSANSSGGVHFTEVSEPGSSAVEPQGVNELYNTYKNKYKMNSPLSQFVLDAAFITNRTEEVAKCWLKALKDESLDTVFDLKLLAYEDWERLPLTVFSCRVMQNMIYGINNTPLKEKQLPMNPNIQDYDNRMSIHDFLVSVCSKIGRPELTTSWENKFMAQDIRTVGELKTLHHDDWSRLGLSVFGYRILQNVIYQRGWITID